jgi:hypothetical protein
MAATLRPASRHDPALDISYLSLRKSIVFGELVGREESNNDELGG